MIRKWVIDNVLDLDLLIQIGRYKREMKLNCYLHSFKFKFIKSMKRKLKVLPNLIGHYLNATFIWSFDKSLPAVLSKSK